MFEQNGFAFFVIEVTQSKEMSADSVFEIG